MSNAPTAIIPCYNEEGYVGRVLDDLEQQTMPPAAVFVVDCGSEDATVAEAEKHADRLPLEVLQSPYRSAAAARNTGAERAQTEYLLFLDADMRLPPNFVEQIMRCAANRRADFVSPKFKTEGQHPIDAFYIWCENVRIRRYYMGLKHQPMGLGGGMLIGRRRHKEVGGYDGKKQEFDDVDYCKRLGTLGVSFAFAKDAVAVVSNRRFVEQGRLKSMLQLVPTDTVTGRRLVRPVMKKLGVAGKWDKTD